MSWKVVYYFSPGGENPVSRFIDSCTKRQQVKILRVLKHLEEYGAQMAIPHIKKLTKTPFWEIRILGRDNIRIIYVVEVGKLLILLHGFFKKTRRTPKKELAICYRRYEDFKERLTK